MTYPALAVSLLLTLLAALVRAGGASLVRTARADALHDAADGNHRAATVARLLEDRSRLQPALGMVHTTLLVLAAVTGVWALTRQFSEWQLLIALVGLGTVLAFGGDFLPRAYGRAHPGRLAYRFSRLVAMAVALGDRASDVIQEEPEPEEEPPAGQAEAEERALISQVMDFTDTIVREVMVPRPDMITVRADASLSEVLDVVISEGKSRLPVIGNGRDDIVGIIYAKDILGLLRPGIEAPVTGLPKRDPYFVPETKRVSELLREMQANQVHLAIVVDEFGGTAGLVTIEDLIEELVGEIVDEYDVEEPMITPLEEGGYLVDARLDLDELVELLGIGLPDEEWDTVGGLLLGLAGRVPREGESFELEGFLLVADHMQGRRVGRVRVTPR
jgi:CBS domain containing-hemolysin-like protein